MRSKTPGDIDNAIIVSEKVLNDILVDKLKTIKNKETGVEYDLTKMDHSELMDLAEMISTNRKDFSERSLNFAQAMRTRAIRSSTKKPKIIDSIRDLRIELDKKFFDGQKVIKEIFVMTETSQYYQEPMMKLKKTNE